MNNSWAIKRQRFCKCSVLFICLFFLFPIAYSQHITDDKIIDISKLYDYLKPEVQRSLLEYGEISNARLAKHFRTVFSQKYYYDWQNNDVRFEEYEKLYKRKGTHSRRAREHMSVFESNTLWKLPFISKEGKEMTSYPYRHLARQHKMFDIGLQYYYADKDPQYIVYFEEQMRSLNVAFEADAFETIKDGNGAYEVYRSGQRILNWLSVHNLYLGEEEYSDDDQLYTIATLIHHAAHLYERNASFRNGNHQTRGMTTLAMLAVLLSDFDDASLWYERAMARLGEHLDKEINPDGFQFERSVHYHIADIANYFYVYQLVKKSNFPIDAQWEAKLKDLFETLVKISYPDMTAPVLQDDTRRPWAEVNDIRGALTLGYLLFDNPTYGYFSNATVESNRYWHVDAQALEKLKDRKQKKPRYSSFAFEHTGYYISREGFKEDQHMMIVAAGIEKDKPDHQHGDMLGIQAYANGHVLLPNYQVRYSLEDYQWFKNSMVKNVALVDTILQGQIWRTNKGKSGFGKFGKLPIPKVDAWVTGDRFDFFAGTHDGFDDTGVKYGRKIISIHGDFWIVIDGFKSESLHDYKQVWQGNFTDELGPDIITKTFSDGTGFDILQLNSVDKIEYDGRRGKRCAIVTAEDKDDFEFVSILYPYNDYNDCLKKESSNIGDWTINDPMYSDISEYALSKENEVFLFNVEEYRADDMTFSFSSATDIYISHKEGSRYIQFLGDHNQEVFLTKDKKTDLLNIGVGEIYKLN